MISGHKEGPAAPGTRAANSLWQRWLPAHFSFSIAIIVSMIDRLLRSFRGKAEAPPSEENIQFKESGFFCGANLPWIVYGCDFGFNAWQPAGGMSQPARREMLQQSFSELSNAGLNIVRWFMICDGRAGLQFGRDDVRLDSAFFPDVDAALQIAEQCGIRIMFTLFDFHWFHAARMHQGVQLGGRAPFINNRGLRNSLLQNVVQPILARYGNHPNIHSWDVFNEPEWILSKLGTLRLRDATRLDIFRGFLKDVVQMIHNESCHPASLGLAGRGSLELFEDCSLDFHQFHWYDKQKDELWTPLQSRVPVVLGEFPTSESGLSVETILRHAREAGFAGALAWSAKDTAGYSSLPSLIAGHIAFRDSTPAPLPEKPTIA